MNLIKLLAAILTMGGLIFGSVQLGQVSMPHFEQLCGDWG
jgi:hypothetical protein